MPTIQYPASKIITHRNSISSPGRFRQGWVTGETGGSGANLRNCAHAFWGSVDFSAVNGMIIDRLWIRIPDTTNYGLTAAQAFHFYKSPYKYLATNSSELDPNDYTPAGEFSNVDGTEKEGFIASSSIARSEANPTDTLLTAEWLQHVMDGFGIAAYRRTQPSTPSGSHYTRETLSMPVLIVEYHAPTSTGLLDKSTVDAGDDITIDITPAEAGRTHKAIFTFGSYSHTSALLNADTLEYAYAIPMTWLNNIPNSVTGIANCRLETYAGGVLMGYRDYPFTITCPGSVVPSLVFPPPTRIDNGVPSAWDQYVQGYSKASLAITGATGAYGSTISSRSIIGAGFDSNGAAELVTGPITQSGTIIFTARVTDSRGRTKTETREINVTAYEKPKFLSAPISERCLVSGVVDVAGTYILAFCEYTCTAIGTNTVSGTVKYRETGTTTWSIPVSISSLVAKKIGTGELVPGKTYDVLYTIVDTLATQERTDYISKAEFLLDLKRNGKSIGLLTTFGDDGTINVGGVLKRDGNPYCEYRIGDLKFSTNSTNPGTYYPGTTWSLWGAGKVPVCVDVSQTEFNSSEKTGGEKNHTLTAEEMPVHSHAQNPHTHPLNKNTDNDADAFENVYVATSGTPRVATSGTSTRLRFGYSSIGNATATNQNAGYGWAHNNLQPFITCYIWKRTA